jgi:phage-related minor tail protein
MIISLPATGHDHLADALVRDLGFTRTHVDAGVRALLEELDPIVSDGVTMANQGFSPRLKSKLEQYGGWDRLLNPPRPGSMPDKVAAEVKRLLDVLRGCVARIAEDGIDVVVVGASSPNLVAILTRYAGLADHYIEPAGVVGEQAAIVAYALELRETGSAVDDDVSYTIVDDATA